MSANAAVWPGPVVGSTIGSAVGSTTQENVAQSIEAPCEVNLWSPGNFAREQILGLVRRVFFSGGPRPVKQVVFSAAEPHLNVATLCEQVSRALALETSAQVVTVVRHEGAEEIGHRRAHSQGSASIVSCATQRAVNLWRLRAGCLGKVSSGTGTGADRLAHLAELRNYFQYAVIEGPAAAMSSEAAWLGQMTDGIILVLGAHSTRKATARKLKETLEGAHSHILGTVLSERRFPIPERIYSRL
jgi:hypothetical protein